MRELKVSPERRAGQPVGVATPAAVTMFIAPGPIDDVHDHDLPAAGGLREAAAASPMPSSLWPR